MSNQHKLNWLAVVMYLVLVSMITWLVVVNHARGAENGLQCIYNCDNYKEVLDTLK